MSNDIKYNQNAKNVLRLAKERAEDLGVDSISLSNASLSLIELRCGFGVEALIDIGAPIEEIEASLLNEIASEKPTKQEENELLEAIDDLAFAENIGYIGTEHILMAILSFKTGVIYETFKNNNVDILNFIGYLFGVVDSLPPLEIENERKTPVMAPSALTMPYTKPQNVLHTYGTDLVERCRCGKADPVIGREEEISRVIKILCRKNKSNPVLIGDAGTGKTCIAEGVAQRIYDGDVPPQLQHSTIVSLDIFAMLGGTMYRGQFEDKIKAMLEEVKESGGLIILFIDEIHNIVGAGVGDSEGTGDLSNILKPALSRGEFSCIGATTVNEYKKHIEKDAALERRFQRVFVDEPSGEDTFKILKGIKESYCLYHNGTISNLSLKYIVDCCLKIDDRKFPDKAIDLLDMSFTEARCTAKAKIPRKVCRDNGEIDRLLCNAILTKRKGEQSYFVDQKIKRIYENREINKVKVTKKHINAVLKGAGIDPIAKRRVGFQ